MAAIDGAYGNLSPTPGSSGVIIGSNGETLTFSSVEIAPHQYEEKNRARKKRQGIFGFEYERSMIADKNCLPERECWL